MLPLAVGSLIWMCFSIIVLFRSLRLLVREILPGEWTANQEAVFLMLVLPAAYRGLWTGADQCLDLCLPGRGAARDSRAALDVGGALSGIAGAYQDLARGRGPALDRLLATAVSRPFRGGNAGRGGATAVG